MGFKLSNITVGILKRPVFEWSKVVLILNGPVLESHSKLDQKCPVLEWYKWATKCLVFKCFQFSNVRFLDPALYNICLPIKKLQQ